jgi:hypothetical protein
VKLIIDIHLISRSGMHMHGEKSTCFYISFSGSTYFSLLLPPLRSLIFSSSLSPTFSPLHYLISSSMVLKIFPLQSSIFSSPPFLKRFSSLIFHFLVSFVTRSLNSSPSFFSAPPRGRKQIYLRKETHCFPQPWTSSGNKLVLN